jgi:ATP-dependent RNA helicase DDX19/DBP5
VQFCLEEPSALARCLSPAIRLHCLSSSHKLNSLQSTSLSDHKHALLTQYICIRLRSANAAKNHRYARPPRQQSARICTLRNMSTTDEKPAVAAPAKPTTDAPAEKTEDKPTENPAESSEAPAETPAEATEESSLAAAQVDGSGPPGNGSAIAETDFRVEVKLADRQKDPNDPLFSVKSFEELKLSDELLKGIRNMNFRKPSKIQEKALPLLLMNPPTNMIAQSQSGTGKTAAFSLNILSRIDISNVTPQALVLAPSRELARQILGVITHMGQFMPCLTTMAVIPDSSKRNQRYDAHVLVGTPGTVMDMCRRRYVDAKNMKILVLDEADNMLDQQGLGEQCTRVKALLPKNMQTVLFSATFPAHVIQYAQRFAPDANVLTLAHEELSIEGIKQLYIDINGQADKYDTLLKFYGLMTQASSIIFVRVSSTRSTREA